MIGRVAAAFPMTVVTGLIMNFGAPGSFVGIGLLPGRHKRLGRIESSDLHDIIVTQLGSDLAHIGHRPVGWTGAIIGCPTRAAAIPERVKIFF